MKLQYLGHASFRIISETGTTLVTDPYSAKTVGFAMTPVRCDVVTVSHHHADHDCTDGILGDPAVLDEPVSCAADDVAVTAYPTFHDDVRGAKRGKNIVFCFNVDGLSVVHMGDIGCFDADLAEKIHGCDVLLLPVGGVYTVDAVGAKRWVDAVQPAIVVPMHYKTAEHTLDIESADRFLSLFDPNSVEISDSDSLVLYDEPQPPLRVIVLKRFED